MKTIDGPASFAAETHHPSEIWLKAVCGALSDTTKALPPPLHLKQGHDVIRLWTHLVAKSKDMGQAIEEGNPSPDRIAAVLNTGIKSLKLIQKQHTNWLHDGRLDWMGTWHDNFSSRSKSMGAAGIFLALEALDLLPTSRPETVHTHLYAGVNGAAQGSWMLRLLDMVIQASWNDWGTATHHPALEGWLQAVDRVRERLHDEGMAAPLWEAHARMILTTIMAGHSDLPGMRERAETWQIGWPKAWGGQGMALENDLPLLLSMPGVSTLLTPHWVGRTELVHAIALEHCMGDEAPSTPPKWAEVLVEGWAARRTVPADLFADPQGDKFWPAWVLKQQQAYEKDGDRILIPAMPTVKWGNTPAQKAAHTAAMAPWRAEVARIQKANEHERKDRAQQWPAKMRQWQLDALEVVKTPEEKSSPRRLRSRS